MGMVKNSKFRILAAGIVISLLADGIPSTTNFKLWLACSTVKYCSMVRFYNEVIIHTK